MNKRKLLFGDNLCLCRPGSTGRTISIVATPDLRQMRYFAAVVRGEIRPSGLSSLGNNLVVTEILDAARRSAETGRRVILG